MKSLTTADFSFNEFSGKLPETGQFAFFNPSSFAGNPQLCGPLLNNPCNFTAFTTPPGRNTADFKLIFALDLLICSLVFAIAAIIKAKSFRKKGPGSWKMTAFQKLDFTVSDILECVKDGNVIGRGGAGIVYHGKMPKGVEIAVKTPRVWRQQPRPRLPSRNPNPRQHQAQEHRALDRVLLQQRDESSGVRVHVKRQPRRGGLGKGGLGKEEGPRRRRRKKKKKKEMKKKNRRGRRRKEEDESK